MHRLAVIATFLLAVGVSCEEEQPCDEYVEYMCACHGHEEGFDCETLRRTYADASPDLQDQCIIDLMDQQEEDELTDACAAADTDTGQ